MKIIKFSAFGQISVSPKKLQRNSGGSMEWDYKIF